MANAPGISCPNGRRGLEHPRLDKTPTSVRFRLPLSHLWFIHLSPWICRASPCIPEPQPRTVGQAEGPQSLRSGHTDLLLPRGSPHLWPAFHFQIEREASRSHICLPASSFPHSTQWGEAAVPHGILPHWAQPSPPCLPRACLGYPPTVAACWLPSIPRGEPTAISKRKVTHAGKIHFSPPRTPVSAPHCRECNATSRPGPAASHGPGSWSGVRPAPCAWGPPGVP